MTNKTSQNNELHFGIDVAKDKLDIHCLETGRDWQIANTAQALTIFARDEQALLVQGIITIETTGGYERVACTVLHQHGYKVHQAHSFRVKSYIRSLGQHAKTDRLDARALAAYGCERKQTLRLYVPASANQQRLKSLVMRRQELVRMRTQEKNRLAGPTAKGLEASFKSIIKVLQRQIESIEKEIATIIAQDRQLAAKAQVLLAIKGIGQTSCNALLALMPELGTLDRKQVAALSGLAPYARDSGSHSGYRSIKPGRPAVTRALFMAALSAARYNKTLREFYLRLTNNGKLPIVAITATARKLATIANAKIRDMELS